MKYVHIIICTFFLSFSAFSQKESQVINLSNSLFRLDNVIGKIESQTDFFFAYNSQSISSKDLFLDLDTSKEYTLEMLLFEIENQFVLNIEIEASPSSKIILSQSEERIITGTIVDNLSQESIIGATVFSSSNVATISDVNGYFRIVLPVTDTVLFFQNMGYLQEVFKPQNKYAKLRVELETNLDLDIVITPDPTIKVKQDKKIGVKELEAVKGIGGTSDLFGYLRNQPGISSGSEGQNGFIVRGGGPHQNLILLDGLPIYEGSHLGGLSSIFIPQAINNISFYKSAFPARYGGKLSGVLDINLKDGDALKYNRKFSIGLEGITGHIDGPITDKTTISFNGKLSLFSLFVEPFAKLTSNVNDLNLRYNDSYAKMTHSFSDKHTLSLTGYLGEDLVQLSRDGTFPSRFQDFNRISWGNKVVGVQYSGIISDRITLNTNVGITNYNYRSRGTYEIIINRDNLPDVKSFDILSVSNLSDIIISPQVEYYSDNFGKFTFGVNFIKHTNEPNIIESERFSPNSGDIIVDTTYRTNEVALYLENNLWLSKKVYINSGLRLNSYYNDETEFHFLQPRFSFNYKFKNEHIQLSYARMSQFTHLLSNPGLGIPSDLWVPSTGAVPPELSHNLSLDYKYFQKNLSWGFSVFYKSFDNLIEYTDPADILYSFVLDDQFFQIQVDNNSWEERVSLGKGRAYGLETFINYKKGAYTLDLAYTFSKSERSFDRFDDGEYFPYRFDRPHDIKANLNYKISPNQSFSINWTFGNGNAYTIVDGEEPDPVGNPIGFASSRNNFRLKDYHHLDVNYQITKQLKNDVILTMNLGIYNIYNRKNTFYEYLVQGSISNPPELVGITLYPILPQVNFSWSW